MLVRASGQPPGGWGTSSGESGRLTAPGTSGGGGAEGPASPGTGGHGDGAVLYPAAGPGTAGPGGHGTPGRQLPAAAPGQAQGAGRELGLGGPGQEQPPPSPAAPCWVKLLRQASAAPGSSPGHPRGRHRAPLCRKGLETLPAPPGAGGGAPRHPWGSTSPPPPQASGLRAAGPPWEPGVPGAGAQLNVSEEEEHPTASPTQHRASRPLGPARATPVTPHQAVLPAAGCGGCSQSPGKAA